MVKCGVDTIIMQGNFRYWEDVYLGEVDFVSKQGKKIIPWDSKQVDLNLSAFIHYSNFVGNVLDVGCGLGLETEFLANAGCKVVGLDISPKCIELAKENVKSKNAKLVVGDVYTYKPEHKFDMIFDRGLAHNEQENLKELFNKYESLLDENGRVYLLMGNHNAKPSKYTEPTRTKLSTVENACGDNFKIKLAKEVSMTTHQDIDDTIAWNIILEKKKYGIYI